MSSDIYLHYPDMDNNTARFIKFVIEKIEKGGGCLKFQHLTGHLSQLPRDVRDAVVRDHIECKKANNRELLCKVLCKYDDIFIMGKDEMVKLKKTDHQESSAVSSERIYSNSSVSNDHMSNRLNTAFPNLVFEKEGVVIKVFPAYGFISSKDPKGQIYFTPACFDNKENALLTDFVQPGHKVYFNARKKNDNESLYNATKVWFSKKVENQVLHPEGFKKTKKTRETGLYDPCSSEGVGKVQKVFDTHGFLIIDDDPQNTVFFHKNTLCNVENITNLAKVLHPGDIVSYTAMRSSKKDAKARWKAIKVWLKKEAVPPDDKKSGSSVANMQKTTREVLRNEKGKLYPHPKGTVIRFGKEHEKIADADSCIFYAHELVANDPVWEFMEGESVFFDGIQIKSAPGWKALLCWTVKKPNIVLQMDIGDIKSISDEDADDVNESGSITSNSVSSEVAPTSNGRFKNSEYNRLSSQPSKNNKKQRSSKARTARSDKDFSNRRGASRSISRSSGNSQHSSSSQEKDFRQHYDAPRSISCSSDKSWNSLNKDKDFRRHKDPFQYETKCSNFNKRIQKSTESISCDGQSKNSKGMFLNSEIFDLPNSGFENDSGIGSEDHHLSHYEERLSPDFDNSVIKKNTIRDKTPESFTRHVVSDIYQKPQNGSQWKNMNFTNWGDSPYPDEELHTSEVDNTLNDMNEINSNSRKVDSVGKCSSSHSNTNYLEQKVEKVNSDDDDFIDALQDTDAFENEDCTENNSHSTVTKNCHKNIVEMALKGEAFADVVQQLDSGKEKIADEALQEYVTSKNNMDNVLEETSDDLCDTSSNEPKLKPYVKHFLNVSGKILRVFCKYAIIENSNFKKPASFFWSDLYWHKDLVSDNHEDLKVVLKAGEIIKCNCIEIMDDSGSIWQKVTIAWKGEKPRVNGLTPEAYMAENNLIVSLDTEKIEVHDDDKPKSTRLLNKEKEEPVVPPRKFLTDAISDVEDEDQDCGNVLLSAIQESAAVGEQISHSSRQKDISMSKQQILSETMPHLDLKQLIETVSKKLVSFKYSEEDVDVASADVVSFILSRADAKISNKQSQEKGCQTVPVISCENGKTIADDISSRSSQTIITGDVIAQSIFTQ